MEFSNQWNRFTSSSEAASGGESDGVSANAQENLTSGEGQKDAASEASPQDKIKSLEVQIAEMNAKYSELNDRLYRSAADFDNSRKLRNTVSFQIRFFLFPTFAGVVEVCSLSLIHSTRQ